MNKIYDPEHYRVVFFSSAPIGVPFLEEVMKDQRFEVVGVVTQADKPVGRGLQMQENIIKTTAKELFAKIMIRYFFMKESLQEGRETLFITHNLQWDLYEDRGIVVYAHQNQHKKLIPLFQKLLLP
jgi:methionyl-tRNA formyltransferase